MHIAAFKLRPYTAFRKGEVGGPRFRTLKAFRDSLPQENKSIYSNEFSTWQYHTFEILISTDSQFVRVQGNTFGTPEEDHITYSLGNAKLTFEEIQQVDLCVKKVLSREVMHIFQEFKTSWKDVFNVTLADDDSFHYRAGSRNDAINEKLRLERQGEQPKLSSNYIKTYSFKSSYEAPFTLKLVDKRSVGGYCYESVISKSPVSLHSIQEATSYAVEFLREQGINFQID